MKLTIHPLCKILPPLTDEEFNLLVESIKQHGRLLEPISLSDVKDRIIDGANRYRAMQKLGMEVRWDIDTQYVRKPGGSLIRDDEHDAIRAFIISKNFRRRQMTPEKQRELLEALIKAEPEKSDRQIAKETGKSPTTVGKIRTQMEEAGDVSTVDTRTDTKGRKQPARKAKPKQETAETKPRREQHVEPATAEAKPRRRSSVQIALDQFEDRIDAVRCWGEYTSESDTKIPPLTADQAARAITAVDETIESLRKFRARIKAAVVPDASAAKMKAAMAAADGATVR
jgi:ParB-like chromosome segregation protein Spo0J